MPCRAPLIVSPWTVSRPVTLVGCSTRTSLPDTTPCVYPLGSVKVPVISKLPEYSDPFCLSVISIDPPPRLALVAVHVPTHLPVTSTVGATVAGPRPPAHPAITSSVKPVITNAALFMVVLLSRDRPWGRRHMIQATLAVPLKASCQKAIAQFDHTARHSNQRVAIPRRHLTSPPTGRLDVVLAQRGD